MKYIYFLLFLPTLIVSAFNTVTFADSSQVGRNKQYKVTVEDKTTLIVYDIDNNKLIQENLNINIVKIEVCPKYPYISIVGYPLGYIKKPHYDDYLDKKYFIYDILNKKRYSRYHINEEENRWSSSGEYTYIGDSINLVLVPTKKLREFLNDPTNIEHDGIIIIKGHPIGVLKQKAWIGERIFYSNGIDGQACFGFYDIEYKKNYFITCCGNIKSKVFNEECGNYYEAKDIVSLAISMENGGKLYEVSKDFYQDASNIIEKLEDKEMKD